MVTLEKLAGLCERSLYSVISSSNLKTTLPLNGPFGVLLKQNVLNEWWHTIVTSSNVATFPVTELMGSDSSPQRTNDDQFSGRLMSNTFSMSCLSFYPSILQFVGGRLPFALAKHGGHSSKSLQNSQHFDLIGSEKDEDSCLVTAQYFVDHKSSLQWFNDVQRQRLAWWKKFSSTPSNFQLTNITTTDEDSQLIEVQFNNHGVMQTIEQLYNHGARPIQQLALTTDTNCQGKDGRKTIFPNVIECLTSINTAALVYLMDAFREKRSLADVVRLILTLHQRLTPYKASIAIVSATGSGTQLRDVAKYVVKELHKQDISVLYLPDLSSSPLEQQFIRYDEMGIPYCIVLNEGTLKSGIIGMRSRDTTLREQIHLSEIINTVVKYVSSY